MSAKSRVKLKIYGNDFIITSDDSEDYIRQIGSMVEERIKKLMEDSENISVSMAAIFAAMEFCDESVKSKQTADNLRIQIKEYLNDAADARTEAEEARRKISSLNNELQILKARSLQKENRK